MDISIIREMTGFRILVSLVLGAGILFSPRRYFILWIPLLTYSGIWIYSPNNPREYMFLSSYIEFTLALTFLYKFFTSEKDNISLWLFLIVLVSLPSLYNAYYYHHFFISIFLFVCLLSGAGVYLFFKNNMEKIDASRLADYSVLLWLALGIFIKIYLGARLNQPWFIQRGGGILGSNHVAGILFLLLPIVRARWIVLIALIFLVLQFSRGIYLALIVYCFAWISVVNPRQGVRWLIAISVIGVLVSLLLANITFHSEYGLVTVKDFIFSRFKMFEGVNIVSLLSGLGSDSRWDILDMAGVIGKHVAMTGVGFGGFMWGLERLGDPLLYTNAHNLYVTLFVEGGFACALAFICLALYIPIIAYKTDKKIFVGLVTWMFYGLYAGEIYEVGGMVTAGDYYVFLFVVALLFHLRQKNILSKDKIIQPIEVASHSEASA